MAMNAKVLDSSDGSHPRQELFDNVGKKVEGLTLEDSFPNGTSDATEDSEQRIVDEIESLCMNCHENGITRLLLTRIPYFREIILMSFFCPHCNFRNSEIQSAGEIQQRGSRVSLRVELRGDLSRQVVKSDTCVVRVEEIELEIPAGRGQLTNVEGLLQMVSEDLQQQQDQRKEASPQLHEQIEGVIQTLNHFIDGSRLPVTITIDDPAGNSSIEPSPGDRGGKYKRSEYPRSAEQNAMLGLTGDAEAEAPGSEIRPEYKATQMMPQMPVDDTPLDQDNEIAEGEVYTFPATCPGCMKDCDTNMKMVNIPHFQQVVIMSTVCQHCGYRSNEVKSGGAVPLKGRRITLSVETPEDLARDILKSESCTLQCPELSLSVEPGTLGGRFTTIEGLLTQVRDDLRSSVYNTDEVTGVLGDSMDGETRSKWNKFFDGLTAAIEGKTKFLLVLEDPLASSYVQSRTAPEPDSQILVVDYVRTEDEEEHLGLRDIKTEGYEEDAEADGEANETENHDLRPSFASNAQAVTSLGGDYREMAREVLMLAAETLAHEEGEHDKRP